MKHTYGSNTPEIEQSLALLDQYFNTPVDPEYYHPRTIDKAISLLKEFGDKARLVAGGIDVLGLLKARIQVSDALVDIKKIPGLNSIILRENGLYLGSLTRIKELEQSASVAEHYPVLQTAARSIASPHLRNMATLAGNLCQEVRCMYYRRSPDTGNVYECYRKNQQNPCYARNGENQYHAIFPGTVCCAVCPSDMATALMALDASLQTVNAAGGRNISIDQLYSQLGTNLEPGEIITGVSVPGKYRDARQNFIKFRIRNTIDMAIVSVASVAILEEQIVREIRIVIGGVSYAPYRDYQAEQILTGSKLTHDLIEEAAGAALGGVQPLSKNKYKVHIARALLQRSIMDILGTR